MGCGGGGGAATGAIEGGLCATGSGGAGVSLRPMTIPRGTHSRPPAGSTIASAPRCPAPRASSSCWHESLIEHHRWRVAPAKGPGTTICGWRRLRSHRWCGDGRPGCGDGRPGCGDLVPRQLRAPSQDIDELDPRFAAGGANQRVHTDVPRTNGFVELLERSRTDEPRHSVTRRPRDLR